MTLTIVSVTIQLTQKLKIRPMDLTNYFTVAFWIEVAELIECEISIFEYFEEIKGD